MHILRGQDRHPLAEGPVPHLALHRRADADLYHAGWIDDSFVDGMKEHRAMSEQLAEIIRPGIDMRVEMHQPQRVPEPLAQRTQQR